MSSNRTMLIAGGVLLTFVCWFVADRAVESQLRRDHVARSAIIGAMERKLYELEKKRASRTESPGSHSRQDSRGLPAQGESIRLPAAILRTQIPLLFTPDRHIKPALAQMLQLDSREVRSFEAALGQFETELLEHQARTTRVITDSAETLELTVEPYEPALPDAIAHFRQALDAALDRESAELARSLDAPGLARAVDMLAIPDATATVRITRAVVPKYPNAVYDVDMTWTAQRSNGPVKSGRTANLTPGQLQKLIGRPLQGTTWGPSLAAETLRQAIDSQPEPGHRAPPSGRSTTP